MSTRADGSQLTYNELANEMEQAHKDALAKLIAQWATPNNPGNNRPHAA